MASVPFCRAGPERAPVVPVNGTLPVRKERDGGSSDAHDRGGGGVLGNVAAACARLVTDHSLSHYKIGGRVRFADVELDAWLDRRKVEGTSRRRYEAKRRQAARPVLLVARNRAGQDPQPDRPIGVAADDEGERRGNLVITDDEVVAGSRVEWHAGVTQMPVTIPGSYSLLWSSTQSSTVGSCFTSPMARANQSSGWWPGFASGSPKQRRSASNDAGVESGRTTEKRQGLAKVGARRTRQHEGRRIA